MEGVSLGELLKFTRLLNGFRQVTRAVHANGEERFENDVEHSYQLAMLGWYIVKAGNMPLQAESVLKYALVHDLVEIYAGDTYTYTDDWEELASKPAREEAARLRLKKELPEFPELHALIERYERKEDPESKFVYALDKLQPILNIYLNDGRTWKEKNITLEMLVLRKREKIAVSSDIAAYFKDIIAVLEKESTRLFSS